MEVELNLFAFLSRYLPVPAAGRGALVTVAEKATVLDLLDLLGVPLDKVKIVFINGVRVPLDTALRPGDRVGVFPAVAGG